VFFRISLYGLAPLMLLAGLAFDSPGTIFAAGVTTATAVIGLAATQTPHPNRQAEQPTNNDDPIL
jgi:hypothetical protein